MFGMEMMLKSMLADAGIDLEQLTVQAQGAFNDAQRMAAQMVNDQARILSVLQANYLLQKMNAAKLDAILKHLDIEPPTAEQATNGQFGIEFHPH